MRVPKHTSHSVTEYPVSAVLCLFSYQGVVALVMVGIHPRSPTVLVTCLQSDVLIPPAKLQRQLQRLVRVVAPQLAVQFREDVLPVPSLALTA